MRRASAKRLYVYLVQIFLPLYDKNGRSIPQAQFERTAAELTQHFGGLTAYTRAPAKGIWKNRGRAIHDDVVVYEVMCPRLQRRWWRAKRTALEKSFRQDTILIRSQTVTQL
jgi:hypothetical protein